MHIGYVLRERPPFSALNFRSEAYHFHKFFMSKYSASEHHHHHLHFFLAFNAAHGRLTQPNSPSSLWSPAFSRSSSLRSPPFLTLPRRSGLSGRPDVSYSQFRRPAFSRLSSPELSSGDPHFQAWASQARSGAPHFHARARSGAAHFSLGRGTYLLKYGVSTPPPPPPGGNILLNKKKKQKAIKFPLSLMSPPNHTVGIGALSGSSYIFVL